MIRGYVEQPSPQAGTSLTLRVSTDAPRFRVEFFRCGERLEAHGGSAWLPGTHAPPHLPFPDWGQPGGGPRGGGGGRREPPPPPPLPFQDWGQPGVGPRGEPLAPWPAYDLPVPGRWRSGVYVAVLVEGDG